jgi:twitching motility protein PilU
LYKQNVISLEEALANADSSTNLSWLINNAKVTETSKVQQSLAASQENDLSSIRLNL